MPDNENKIREGLLAYKKEKKNQKWKYIMEAAAALLVFLILWQLAVISGMVSSRTLPAPTTLVMTFIDKLTSTVPDGNTLGTNILASLQVALTGFVLATVIGVPLGLIMGWYKGADKFVGPIFELLRPVPPIAWIPLIVVFFGIGLQAKAVIIFLGVFVSNVINAYTGIKLTKRTYIDVAKTFGASDFETFMKVGIPYSMPMLFTGLKTSLGSAWSTLVAAEMLAAKAGLGNMLQIGRNLGRPDIVILGMVTIGVLGAIMGGILSGVEKKFLRWKLDD